MERDRWAKAAEAAEAMRERVRRRAAAFAARLNGLCEMEVREAKDGDRVIPGRALVAPELGVAGLSLDQAVPARWAADAFRGAGRPGGGGRAGAGIRENFVKLSRICGD